MKYSDFLSCWSCLGAFLEHLEALFESTSCVLFLQLVPEKLLVVPLMSRTVGNLFYKFYPVTLYPERPLFYPVKARTVWIFTPQLCPDKLVLELPR